MSSMHCIAQKISTEFLALEIYLCCDGCHHSLEFIRTFNQSYVTAMVSKYPILAVQSRLISRYNFNYS